MKIRVKVFLIVVMVFGLLFFGISKIFTKIENTNFNKLEKQAVLENMSRVQSALEGKFDDLAVKLSDWSRWDDTYAFAQDVNPEYVESNLPNETLTQLRLNFILIKNSAGDVVFKKYVKNNNEEAIFPQDLEKLFSDPKIAIAGNSSSITKIAGLVNTDEGIFVLAVQSITSSDGTAPPRGLIAFGYAADDAFVATLSKATVLKLDYLTSADASKDKVFKVAQEKLNQNNNVYIDAIPSTDSISSFVLFPDIFGSPAIIFRAQIPRDIHKVGLENTKRLDIFLIIVGIFEVAVILILFELFVLRKIYKLVTGVQLVSAKNNNTQRLAVEGSDEFAQLDTEINEMLETLSTTRAEKKESESRFMSVADAAPVMIWVSDTENKIIYVNGAMVKFLGKSEDELFGIAWVKVIHPDDKDRVVEEFQRAFKNQEQLSIKYRVVCAEGTYKWIRMEAVTRVTSQGVLKGYVGTAVDVTQLEEADLEKHKHVEEIQRLNVLINDREFEIEKLKNELKSR